MCWVHLPSLPGERCVYQLLCSRKEESTFIWNDDVLVWVCYAYGADFKLSYVCKACYIELKLKSVMGI